MEYPETGAGLRHALERQGVVVTKHYEEEQETDAGVELTGGWDVQITPYGAKLYCLGHFNEAEEALYPHGSYRNVAELVAAIKRKMGSS